MNDLEKCLQEEQSLRLDYLNAELALAMGMEMIQEAKRRKNKITVDISAFGRRLFHYSSDGNAPSNDEMVRRKANSTLYTGHSSLWVHYALKDFGMSISEKWHLDPSNYADVGGSFPIRLIKSEGVIGTVTVSGFAHTEDHAMAVYGLQYAKDLSKKP